MASSHYLLAANFYLHQMNFRLQVQDDHHCCLDLDWHRLLIILDNGQGRVDLRWVVVVEVEVLPLAEVVEEEQLWQWHNPHPWK